MRLRWTATCHPPRGAAGCPQQPSRSSSSSAPRSSPTRTSPRPGAATRARSPTVGTPLAVVRATQHRRRRRDAADRDPLRRPGRHPRRRLRAGRRRERRRRLHRAERRGDGPRSSEIDPARRTATVQPGVLNGDLGRAVAAHGLRYTPDPGSREISSIGGNIATNAGGMSCCKYGVTADHVAALTAVLADGTVVRTGAAHPQERHRARPDPAAGRLRGHPRGRRRGDRLAAPGRPSRSRRWWRCSPPSTPRCRRWSPRRR